MSVGWHVDHFIITHRSQTAVEKLVHNLDSLYGTMDPIKVHSGNVHDFLIMTLDFQETGKVKVKMDQYVSEMINGLPQDFDGKAETPRHSICLK